MTTVLTTGFDKLFSYLLAQCLAPLAGRRHAAVFSSCACVIILTLSSIHVAAAAPVDVRIVVDVSKSMHAADPANLRGAGIELLVQNLSDEQSAGLWAYSQLTQKLVEYGSANDLWKQMAAIHARHLEGQSKRANLPGALQAATWDLDRPDRPVTHLVLFSNGRIDQGLTPLEHNNVRQLLLNSWAAKLRDARVIVHTLAIAQGPQTEVETDLLRQLADLSGGLHKTVSDQSTLQAYLLDVLALAQHAPQVQPDTNGRFQIAPGDQALNVLWMQGEAARDGQTSPVLLMPDGQRLDRLTPLKSGRWVLAQNFEMVTVREPQVGWWQVEGVTPKRLTVLGDIEIRVDGLATPVVPTEESHALIRLFSQGQLIEDAGFLDLLDVRVWLKDERQTVPLPVDRSNEAFQAFFVNLGDGAYELEVEVAAPTFRRQKTVPFVAANPMRVDFATSAEGELVAWLQFNHADVDYGTVRAGAKVRKPPQVGVIVPAERLPAGLFKIPLGVRDGVVELTFSISGNYLNTKGFFMKSRPQALTLPLVEETVFRFAADGKLLNPPVLGQSPLNPPETLPAGNLPGSTQAPAPDAPAVAAADVVAAASQDSDLPLLPLWFVALVTLVNAAVGGLLWWFNRPKPMHLEPLLEVGDVAAADGSEGGEQTAESTADSQQKSAEEPAKQAAA